MFDIDPPSDDRPFFHQFLRWEFLPDYLGLLGTGRLPFLEAGYFIVLVTLGIVIVLAFVMIIVPLRGLPRGSWPGRAAVYFACLGVGYMLVEIVLMQRLVLPLGEPVTAAAAVLGSMLVGSGLGSLVSARFKPAPSVIRWMCLCVAVALALTLLVDFPHLLLAMPSPFRLVLLCLTVVPPGFVMGMPFPAGLRVLGSAAPEGLPWAWGINGYASVVGSALAPVLAVEAGFTAVFVTASASYVIAAATGLPFSGSAGRRGVR
jgi:hypothetical protein